MHKRTTPSKKHICILKHFTTTTTTTSINEMKYVVQGKDVCMCGFYLKSYSPTVILAKTSGKFFSSHCLHLAGSGMYSQYCTQQCRLS